MKSTALLLETPTPILDVVRVVCLDTLGQVLLVQEQDDPNWKLPGGKVHKNENVLQTAIREIQEELGIKMNIHNITNVIKARIPNSENNRYIIRYSLNDLKFIPNDEVARAEYFNLHSLPPTEFSGHISSAVDLVTQN